MKKLYESDNCQIGYDDEKGDDQTLVIIANNKIVNVPLGELLDFVGSILRDREMRRMKSTTGIEYLKQTKGGWSI